MPDGDNIDVERVDLGPVIVVGWFVQHTELRSVHPHVADTADAWVVSDGGDIIALALVEGGKLRRLGVLPEHRREGIGERIVDVLYDEYGELVAECRESLDANDFYENTGWEHEEIRPGDPEALHVWTYDPD